ncbi:MAG: hypothetical protein Q9212_004419 [Teloschistes hypoglaucus]
MSNSSGQRIPVNRYGLTEVYSPSPEKPIVDVVFVHGLNGDPHNTWTSEHSNVFWPSQILPPILEDEKARILVYGYDADVTSFTDGVSKDKIHNHAEHVVAELAANRRIRKATERPIIWIAHSLGGLVAKRALIHSSEIQGVKTEHLRSIFVSTYGLLFLGTPHHGSDIAQWGNRLEWICSVMLPKKVVDTQPQLIDALKTNNETLQNIDRQFVQIMSRFHIYFFHEGKPTNLKGTLKFVVDETSASPTVQDVERAVIQADHSHMCKFENENAPGFDLVAEGIQRYAEEAPATIRTRWETEKKERLTAKQAQAAEIYTESAKPTPPSDSISSFGGSSLGMDKELQDLDRRLFDRRRHDGTACALVHGQPGAGKSHLTREYVYKNRKKFSGGIFWIVSHLKEERYQAFEAIFQKAVARELPGINTKPNEGGRSFVEAVKEWFESRQEWLIVMDGVTVETDADVTDLARFVPDSRNSSLIYVSRQRNLESKQRLLRPHAIRVPVLKVDDARRLLFKELRTKRPSEEEVKSGIKLVKQVDCLPLAIVAISHRIADTHEPLTRYSMKSYSANPKLEGTYNQILDDLQRLGQMEAWNLINILAFFGHHVPVEMLHLGARALQDIPLKSSEDGGRPDLNVTFGILMRNALLERNEPDSENSSSRDSLVEPEPIDMLKIHSVVQSFCRDSLDSRRMLPEWLQHATQLLECSYHIAHTKIKEKKHQARVSDYRYYQVHCKRLYEHALHYENRRQSLAPIRAVLEPLLDTIGERIKHLEPGSSQESVSKIYQVSIFDRTTSSSDSLGSMPSVTDARTPSHRPSPLPLDHETLWGTDARKPSLESPASIGTPREPRIVGHSPYQGFYDDFGYESDRETPRFSAPPPPMRKNMSGSTERPLTAGTEQENDWQVVASTKRQKKPRVFRDLGSFRPAPARATRASATGTMGHSAERQDSGRSSSEARAALSEVHSKSPPPSRQSPVQISSGITSFWQRRPLVSSNNSQRTWANVAAGQTENPRVQPVPPTPVAPIIPPDQAMTRASARQSNPFSSPLVSELHPDESEDGEELRKSGHLSMRSGNDVSPRKQTMPSYYATSASGSGTNIAQPRYINSDPFYGPPTVIGPNPSGLTYDNIDDNMSISSKRRLPDDFRGEPSPKFYPTSVPPRPPSPSSRASLYPSYEVYYPSSHLPSGYYSQPMSRDASRQSHISAAETEPLHYPPPFTAQQSVMYPVEPPSPRERCSDGRPLRKSPRSDLAFPISSRNISPHDLSQSLPGLGGWAYHQDNSHHPMSRSSSGPGLALEDASGYGLGIVPFDGQLRFGDNNPISVEEARQRTWEWESRLARDQNPSRSRERRRSERRSVPYPDRNSSATLIPTQSNIETLRAMTGELGRR